MVKKWIQYSYNLYRVTDAAGKGAAQPPLFS